MKNDGFTLVELMIAVAVIGVIVAIAYPSYQDSVTRTHRADVQAKMVELGHHLQAYSVINHNYTNATLPNGNLTMDFPESGSKQYTVKLSSTDSTWTLTAEPVKTTLGDVKLNHRGEKCWDKNSSCVLSASTNWDSR